MKVLIITDLEGIIGVDDIFSETSMKKLIEEENLIIRELKRFGIDEITVYYIHNGGTIDKKYSDQILAKTFVNGIKPLNIKSYSYAIMNGFHAKKGVCSKFSHTLRNDIKNVFYNGRTIGEIEIYGYWLLNKQIPILFVSGEEEAAGETFNLQTSYFSTNSNQHLDYQDKLNIYALYIQKCLKSYFPKHIKMDFYSRLYIELINEDISQMIGEFGYSVINNKIVFDNIDNFVVNEIELFDYLQKIYIDTIKRNADWAVVNGNKLRELHIKSLGKNELFNKRLDEITKKDIEQIELIMSK